VAHVSELLEHVGIGGGARRGFLQYRELVLVEQDGRQLPGRVEVEVLARHLRDLDLELLQVTCQLVGESLEEREVYLYPGPFHVHQDRCERDLDVLEDTAHRCARECRPERRVQREHRGAAGAAEGRRRRHRDLRKGDLSLASPGDVHVGLHRAAQVLQ
jgi:hypothetical protein